jgi:peptidoglycan/LPS O-acetylase OafA/YrhL
LDVAPPFSPVDNWHQGLIHAKLQRYFQYLDGRRFQGVFDAPILFNGMRKRLKNSLDLLRLVAATFVLYSHQYALLGLPEPSFFGWTSFGGAGVAIFFFLSGVLVWTSWERDPDLKRFFVRRSLRIFPALGVVVLCSVFLLGPVLSTLHLTDYFAASETWRYLSTVLLLVRHALPGVFADNPFPLVINGSLWTLPVEFLCYITVAVLGSLKVAPRGLLIAANFLLVVLLASFAPLVTGLRFTPHFEMIAMFWAGVFYGYCIQQPLNAILGKKLTLVLVVAAFLAFSLLGPRGIERMAMLVCAAGLVHLALRISIGAKLTDPLGDLSYGLYAFAFPVQQMVVHWGKGRSWSLGVSFFISLLVTSGLAFASWHLVEKRALRFKPGARAS